MSEIEEFEAWKLERLTTSVDLSYQTFKSEREREALAWDAGALAVLPPKDREQIKAILATNPYRPAPEGEEE